MFSRTIPLAAILLSLSAVTAAAQSQGTPPPAGAQPAAAAPSGGGLPKVDIEKLVAPIALYPDVLISQILPAATFPTDIVMAARWIEQHPDLKGLDDQQWDLSVISVCRYKPVLDKLNQDLEWTNALGAAFLDQPNDVMEAIQNLRQRAKDADVLKSTPQQNVVVEGDNITIAPAEKEVVYVPQYNPQTVYVESHDDDDDDDDDGLAVAGALAAGALSFGAGMAMGAWLDNDCDWHGGCVVGCRPGYWGGYGYHGAVAHWDNDWMAARGPRRAVVAGENGGAYRGPHGAAVWGENGRGAAWARPNAYGTPHYGGRYSSYNNYASNRRVSAGNTYNFNRNNVNVDRGYGNRAAAGGRGEVGRGDLNRGDAGRGDRARATPNEGSNARTGERRDAGDRRDAGAGRDGGAADRQRGDAGDRSRAQRGSSSGADRQRSSMSDNRGSREVKRSSSRGSSSRSGGGGGGRRGGGGRGR